LKKRFVREVFRLRPDLREHSGHFYVVPVGHILCGYVFEQISDVAYIWHYSLPLYDRVEAIVLTFGDRLAGPDGTMTLTAGEPSAVAAEFVRRIKPYDALLDSLKEPVGFARHISSLKPFLNPWLQRGYAMTLIMLGRDAEAEGELTMLSAVKHITRYPGFQEDVALVLETLKRDANAARKILMNWESHNKRHLGISE
jgi:hypothetical protein